MPERQRPRVGEILVDAGVIDRTQLKAALGEQARWGRPLGATLIKLGFVEERELVRALAGQLGLPMASLEGKRIPAEVLELVPKEIADRALVIPLFVKREGGRSALYLGVEDPGNLEVFDDLAFRTGMEVKPVLVGPSDLAEAIDRCYHRQAAGASTPAAAKAPAPTAAPPSPPAVAAQRPALRVAPGSEELARHWGAASEPATPASDEAPAAKPQSSTAMSASLGAALTAPPSQAVSASPNAAASASPKTAAPASPKVAVSASPNTASASPNQAVSASPSAAVSASPNTVVSASPSASMSASPSATAAASSSAAASAASRAKPTLDLDSLLPPPPPRAAVRREPPAPALAAVPPSARAPEVRSGTSPNDALRDRIGLVALAELLVEKGLLTLEELEAKVREIELACVSGEAPRRTPPG